MEDDLSLERGYLCGVPATGAERVSAVQEPAPQRDALRGVRVAAHVVRARARRARSHRPAQHAAQLAAAHHAAAPVALNQQHPIGTPCTCNSD